MKKSNEPFRITLEHWDTKITIEKPYSDINTLDLKDMMISLAMAAGFPESRVNEMFSEYDDRI